MSSAKESFKQLEQIKELNLRIALMEHEISALRSVISEFPDFDKECLLQWTKAEAISFCLSNLK